jgi:hypothetical protein
MISKSVLVFWTVFCFMIAASVMSRDSSGSGTMFTIIIQGIIWGIVAIPTALIGALFKKSEQKPKVRDRIILIGVAALTFLLCISALDWPHSGKINDRGATTGELTADKALAIEVNNAHRAAAKPRPEKPPLATKAAEVEPQSLAAPQPSAETVLRAKCESDWPDNFHMRVYCEKQEREAVRKLAQGVPMDIPADKTRIVRAKCESDWPNNFHMRVYCQEQEFDAIRQLRTR